MPEAGLYTRRCVDSVCMVPLGAGVSRLLVPGMAISVIIHCGCVADGMEVTC
jgi:hypothetical protein